jgi:hypothetical protein
MRFGRQRCLEGKDRKKGEDREYGGEGKKFPV